MKVWFIPIVSIFIFSACSTKSSTYRLQNINARQAIYIQKQKALIESLQAQLEAKKRVRVKVRVKTHKKIPVIPTAPKKNIKLKKVEDNNYSSGYMYPKAHKKKKPVTVAQTDATIDESNTMTTAACISMIGQAKFDKYTEMFGSEAASLKRCKMLKAMK